MYVKENPKKSPIFVSFDLILKVNTTWNLSEITHLGLELEDGRFRSSIVSLFYN